VPVRVTPYNPEWKNWFNELRVPISTAVGDLATDVIHVGSTSVEGLCAKPVIDIDIVVEDWDHLKEIVERLKAAGYNHVGDLGIREREAFKPSQKPVYSHNLYVTKRGSISYRNHVLLQKHLTENPKDLRRYNDLKLRLSKDSVDVDGYTCSKTDLILEFLRREGMSAEELEEIRLENLP
jgi:GrpB-like predicted nucleotidyltransferase (UPF0157 family)